MKFTLSLLVAFTTLLSCKAQNPVVAIDANYSSASNGTYFKDLNNEMGKFIGTWLFSSNGINFTLIIQKRETVFNGKHYEDVLIGEYKYEANGIEVVNTLPDISNNNPVKHAIFGNYVLPCDGCTNRKFSLLFEDSQRSYLEASIILDYLINSNPEQIRVKLIGGESTILPDENSPELMRVPYGTYIMTKQ